MSLGPKSFRVAAGVLVTALLAAACGPSDSHRDQIDWYVQDPDLGAEVLADSCDAGTPVVVHELPTDSAQAHAQLVRRLDSDPESVDLMALDASLIPEFADAGFLRTLTGNQVSAVSEGIVPAALEQVTYDDRVQATPWLFDPQLLWYRGLAAERAGLDVAAPIAWEDLIAGAARLGVTVQLADGVGTGMTEWVDALVAANGGTVVDGAAADANIGLDSPAGRAAASVVEAYRDAGIGPGPNADAVEGFASTTGGFLVAPGSAWSDPAMTPLSQDVAAVAYPTAGDEPYVPAAGLVLARSARGVNGTAAQALIDCLTSDEVVTAIVAASGHGPARTAILDDEEAFAELPIIDALRETVPIAQPVPSTPYWSAISRAIESSWAPLDDVSAADSPRESQRAASAALRGELP